LAGDLDADAGWGQQIWRGGGDQWRRLGVELANFFV
jgi:hypothetical protein